MLEHIIPPTETEAIAAYEQTKAADLPLWKRLDAVVLQWIYATVSTDILTSILADDDSAEQAWKKVSALFNDNQNSRAMYLNKEFTNTSLADFSTTNAYCNRLKSLADQLANVGGIKFLYLQTCHLPESRFSMLPSFLSLCVCFGILVECHV